MQQTVSWWVVAVRRAALAGVLTIIAAAANADRRATILIYGDSISAAYGIQREQGWVALLQWRLDQQQRPWRVVNASISGETTNGGLARLPTALAAHDPDLLVIELGGNDGLRGYPIEEIKRNLGQMIQLADPTSRRLLLVPMQIPPNYGHRYTEAFKALFAEVADAHDVPLAESFIDAVALQPGLMQADGIHPTAKAQPLLLDALWPTMAPLLAD